MTRLIAAFKAFWRVLTGNEDLSGGQEKSEPDQAVPKRSVAESSTQNKFNEGAVYAMALLQREARLIDFLKEDISSFSDEQVGAAVKQIHSDCQKVINDTFKVAPIEDKSEGDPVNIQDQYDPALIVMTGNVPEFPPYKGVLRHKGWQVSEFNLPTRSDAVNPNVIQQAEVEIS